MLSLEAAQKSVDEKILARKSKQIANDRLSLYLVDRSDALNVIKNDNARVDRDIVGFEQQQVMLNGQLEAKKKDIETFNARYLLRNLTAAELRVKIDHLKEDILAQNAQEKVLSGKIIGVETESSSDSDEVYALQCSLDQHKQQVKGLEKQRDDLLKKLESLKKQSVELTSELYSAQQRRIYLSDFQKESTMTQEALVNEVAVTEAALRDELRTIQDLEKACNEYFTEAETAARVKRLVEKDLEYLALYKDPWMWTRGQRKHTKRIVVLGETGAGKSTFINIAANYFMSGTVDDMKIFVPTKYHAITNTASHQDKQQHTELNATQVGGSQTNGCTDYVFSNGTMRLIVTDTPGLGDTRGPEQDDVNLDRMLRAMETAGSIDAIVIVVNGQVARNVAVRLLICLFVGVSSLSYSLLYVECQNCHD